MSDIHTDAGERVLTELDHVRLSRLGAGGLPPALAEALDLADVVPSADVPADTVTMYSQVLVRDARRDELRKVTLCYPHDAEPAQGFISVLSPLGASLLGARAGARAAWRTPAGEEHVVTIESILFQPEASGDYTT